MMRLLALTEGQRMALTSIVAEYVRLSALTGGGLRMDDGVDANTVQNFSLPATFYNAGDGTETTAEEILQKLLDIPCWGFLAFDPQTQEYRFRDSRGDLWGVETTGDHIGPFKVSLLERRS